MLLAAQATRPAESITWTAERNKQLLTYQWDRQPESRDFTCVLTTLRPGAEPLEHQLPLLRGSFRDVLRLIWHIQETE